MILLPARVRGGELPRKHEAGTASGAVLLLRQRRLDTHATVPCRRHDDPSMFPLGLSGLRAPSRRARDACPGGTSGANLRVPLLDSPMDSHHETGTGALSGPWGVRPSTWPAGAHASASVMLNASSESRRAIDARFASALADREAAALARRRGAWRVRQRSDRVARGASDASATRASPS